LSVRLPTVGRGAPQRDDEPGEVRSAAERPDAPVPTIAIVAAVPTAPVLPLAERIVAAATARGVDTAALVVRREAGALAVEDSGFSPESAPGRLAAAGARPVRWARCDPQRAAQALERAFDALPAGRWCIAVGSDVPALLRPRLTILLSSGAARPAFSASARALLDRVDVELADPRPGFAEGLATLL